MKALSWVNALPLRVQLAVIGFGYAAVLAYAAMAEYPRYLAALRDPVYSAGGMWAFGDEVLAWSIFLCFMVPTFFLLLLMRQYEDAYIRFSKILFWFSVTAPLALGMVLLGNAVNQRSLVDPLLWRTWRGPFVLMLIATSRILARPDRSKRLLTRACLVEGGAFAILVTLILCSGK